MKSRFKSNESTVFIFILLNINVRFRTIHTNVRARFSATVVILVLRSTAKKQKKKGLLELVEDEKTGSAIIYLLLLLQLRWLQIKFMRLVFAAGFFKLPTFPKRDGT